LPYFLYLPLDDLELGYILKIPEKNPGECLGSDFSTDGVLLKFELYKGFFME
jgi:hypothetical protein